MATASYRHKTAGRRNAPTVETEPMMSDEARKPTPFAVDRRKVASPMLVWDRQGETSRLSGDKKQDSRHDFEALPLYVREKISPADFVAQLRKRDRGIQLTADDFNGLPEDADPLDFYEHTGHWQNRLIHGDSADVMKSLIAKDGLAGRVQMVYYDPPYGMSYQSNFQPTTNSLNVKDQPSAVPVGDALPIRAFRDSYVNGIHSYLDGVHKQCVLAHQLLSDSGSIFVQIGDENVHRLGVLLDEVFGAENRVATITWRPTGMPSAKLLGESASYLLWYAKDKTQIKYNAIYEERNRQETMDDFTSYAGVELPGDEPDRVPKKEERANVSLLPDGARLFRKMPLTSQHYSHTGRSVNYWFNGRWHSTRSNDQWRVSVHPPLRHGEPSDDDPCPGDPDGRQAECGMCALKHQGRLSDMGKSLHWKWYEEERPGRKLDNVWHQVASPSGKSKRYVVQTSNRIIERCMLMTTEPGDLVLDPTCGSGATADVAEIWGRRWITCDVQRVSIAVVRSHLMTKVYPWHNTIDGNADPAAGFVEETIPRYSAATLAYGTISEPENQIRLVDRTEVDKRKPRICTAFTVESISPYTYLPLQGDDPDGMLPTAEAHDADTLLRMLRSTPVCEPNGRPIFDIVETTPWPDTKLAQHGARCSSAHRDEEFSAAVVIAAADATITKEVARRAAIEARDNDKDCEHLVIVGYDFEAGISPAVQQVRIHQVVASKDLQLPETVKRGADGGSFTLVARPDCFVRDTDDGQLTVELIGCDVFDPVTCQTRSSDLSEVDCWMIDTNHDGLSFRARLTYFPIGLRNEAGFKDLLKSLKKDRDPQAEANVVTTVSQPFPPPDPGRNIAVKVITNTGAEMTTTIETDPHPEDSLPWSLVREPPELTALESAMRELDEAMQSSTKIQESVRLLESASLGICDLADRIEAYRPEAAATLTVSLRGRGQDPAAVAAGAAVDRMLAGLRHLADASRAYAATLDDPDADDSDAESELQAARADASASLRALIEGAS